MYATNVYIMQVLILTNSGILPAINSFCTEEI